MSGIQHRALADIPAEQINPSMTRRLLWGERLMASWIEFKAGGVVPSHQHENEQLGTMSTISRGSVRRPEGTALTNHRAYSSVDPDLENLADVRETGCHEVDGDMIQAKFERQRLRELDKGSV